ncbi:hypothetical protein U3A58_21340, partial [Algoriphagus sp. C2-6-M1]|uniref:hypothetical protein n=1 Tax=Algoriphagus persicinus TaxID=3108754 RepID=UPI002B3BF430
AVSSLDKFHIKRYKNHPISPIGIVGIFSEILNEFLDSLTFWRLAQWRISEHKTVNTPKRLMRGKMFN